MEKRNVVEPGRTKPEDHDEKRLKKSGDELEHLDDDVVKRLSEQVADSSD